MNPIIVIDAWTQGYVSGILLVVLLGVLVFCTWKIGVAHATRQRSHPQDVRDAVQRDLRHIEREARRAGQLATERFLLADDELSTRRRSS